MVDDVDVFGVLVWWSLIVVVAAADDVVAVVSRRSIDFDLSYLHVLFAAVEMNLVGDVILDKEGHLLMINI